MLIHIFVISPLSDLQSGGVRASLCSYRKSEIDDLLYKTLESCLKYQGRTEQDWNGNQDDDKIAGVVGDANAEECVCEGCGVRPLLTFLS